MLETNPKLFEKCDRQLYGEEINKERIIIIKSL
jgi:hypothetical protein